MSQIISAEQRIIIRDIHRNETMTMTFPSRYWPSIEGFLRMFPAFHNNRSFEMRFEPPLQVPLESRLPKGIILLAGMLIALKEVRAI